MARRRGQGLVEYVLVVGVVSLGLVGTVKVFRGAVERAYGRAAVALEGVAAAAPGGGGEAPEAARRSGSMRLADGCLHLDVDEHGACAECGEPQ